MSGDFRCLYRLQLGPDLTFADARRLVPYLRDLGVSHLYLSPSLQARPGSTHGYDVLDPTRVSEELGGEDELRALCREAPGIVLDIVPNHMAADEANPFWPDPKVFDVDPDSGWHRRFFTIDELAGVRVEDPEVFEITHRKVLELVGDGLVDGVRVDHPDGLANPRQYLERLRAAGADHVWVEKILEPGEELRESWPVEGTTGYEFLNDVLGLFVDPAAEETFTELYREVSGESRPFAEVAAEAKLEQARTDFRREVERLRALLDEPGLDEAIASFHVYRTYVEPETGRVEPADREEIARAAPAERLQRVLLLEERGHDEFVTRFQQTTGPVMAKGVEDTAFYRYSRLLALNEVGGDPGRFGLEVERFHEGQLKRRPRSLLTTFTHDTKRSADVRARLAALTWIAGEWAELVRKLGVEGEDEYHVLQTVVGAWPLEPERLDAYVEKALREGKRTSSWLDPDEAAEQRVKEYGRSLLERREVAQFVERVRPFGRRIALGQLLLKLMSPGVPDIYQGDELETLALVDPDNRRPVDWPARRRLLAGGDTKLDLTRKALAFRELGAYRPVDLGPDVCAFTRGDVLVAVPLRHADPRDPGPEWRSVAFGLYARS